MLSYIPKFWWLILLAWLLAMFGDDNFWHFNVMELFASIAIVVGIILAIRKYFSERHRKNRLIAFPNNWFATRDLSRAVLEVTATVDVLIPHHAFGYNGYGFIQGKQAPFHFAEPQQHMSKMERWIMSGTMPLSSVPPDIDDVGLSVGIVLDGEIKKKSEKRMLNIETIGVTPSTPDKEGSQI